MLRNKYKQVKYMDKSLLTKYIEEYDTKNKPELLPFLHSCEGYNGEKIIKSNELKTANCKVFNEDLLYFFYGKPSYPVGEKNETKRTDDLYCPVCFIINPKKVPIYRVFPFDSGAFKEKRYKDFLHRDMKIEDFELENSVDAILSYIATIFDNNRKYIEGFACKRESNYLEIESFLNLLNAKGSFDIDERANTVEIILKEGVIIKDVVECIILPESLMERKEVSKFINNNNIRYKTYTVRRFTLPMRYNETIFNLAMEYLRENGMVVK